MRTLLLPGQGRFPKGYHASRPGYLRPCRVGQRRPNGEATSCAIETRRDKFSRPVSNNAARVL